MEQSDIRMTIVYLLDNQVECQVLHLWGTQFQLKITSSNMVHNWHSIIVFSPQTVPCKVAHLRPVTFLYQQMRLLCWLLDVLQLYSPQMEYCVPLNKILFSLTTNSSDWVHLRFTLDQPTFALCTSRPCYYPQLISISTRYRTPPRVNTSSTITIICLLTTYHRYDLRSIHVHYAY